jgi:Domain of unknown function (DUF305)
MTIRPFIGALARGISKRPPTVAARTVAAASLWMIVGAALFASVDSARPSISSLREAPFLRENEAAMRKMMIGMAIQPSGDVDRDFAGMMTPHHQGAIDMAIAVLRYGHNEQIRRLAQEIIIEQQQEIAAMRLAVGEVAPPSAPAPTAPSSAGQTTPDMDMGVK